MSDIDTKILNFKKSVKSSPDLKDVVNQYLLLGTPYVFKENPQMDYALRKKIADFFDTNVRSVIIIGSAKLGFSVAPGKRFNHIDWDVNKESDIDVAIICEYAFKSAWESILSYERKSIPYSPSPNRIRFLEYFLSGWIRPDLLDKSFEGWREWTEFFNDISYKPSFGNRKIAAGLFFDDVKFMNYHHKNFLDIKQEIIATR